MKTDPDYRRDQRISQKKWLSGKSGYWENYRSNNSEKVERNRALQRLRNKNRYKRPSSRSDINIAKMDVRTQTSTVANSIFSGQFWMVPVIAKMDAAKVFLRIISKGY
jgi:hypothetical protein